MKVVEEQIKFYQQKLQYEIDSWDLFTAVTKEENYVIIDSRSKEAFELEHIPGAINLPHKEMSLVRTETFDKTAIYVSYCDGIGCNASTKGALNLAELGFQVKELMGGLDWWKRDGYETAGTNAQKGREIVCGC